MAFIASSFSVTEDNSLFETDLSGPPSFVLLLKELTFIVLFIIIGVGVSCRIPYSVLAIHM